MTVKWRRCISYILEVLKSETPGALRGQRGRSVPHVEVFKVSSLMSASVQPGSPCVTLIAELFKQETFSYVRRCALIAAGVCVCVCVLAAFFGTD